MMCVAKADNMPTSVNTMSASIEATSEDTGSSSRSPASSVHRRDSDKEPNNNDQEHAEAVNNGEANNTEAASDDFDGCTDEVKVFNDEDERDGDASESYQAELQAEKSSLIHESEQPAGSSKLVDKDLIFRHHAEADLSPSAAALAAVPGMAASFGMASYFVNPYAAYAATNGSPVARSSTGSPLSPYLYGPPPPSSNAATQPPGQVPPNNGPPSDLGSPPPAHVAGLRSPLYSLPHTQYPYSMLGAADQLAAWHHQASVYHQASGALRSTSPYSLPPISSATFSSSMFSPSSLLTGGSSSGHQAGHHHLPHIKAGDFEPASSLAAAHHRKESQRQTKKKETHIKKPLNAFMLYMKEMRPVVQAECTLKESAAINQLLGRRWHGLSREEQAKYYEKARVERQKHMQMYPHWNARDNYRFGVKKKKRKRERSVEAHPSNSGSNSANNTPHNTVNNSMKKCRARYGLDQHNLWCKPCSPLEDPQDTNTLNQDSSLAASIGNGAHHHLQTDLNLLASLPQAPIPPHEFANLSELYVDPTASGGQASHHHQAMDDQDLIKDHVRKKKCIRVTLQRQQRVEAGGASSVSANQQEDNDEDCANHTTGSESSPMGFSSVGSPVGSVTSPLTPNQASWFSLVTGAAAAANFGAFKPPPPRTSSSHHHDPRDEKHPLSICQLTGGSGGSSTGSSHHDKSLVDTSSTSLAAAICAASAVANSAALLGLR